MEKNVFEVSADPQESNRQKRWREVPLDGLMKLMRPEGIQIVQAKLPLEVDQQYDFIVSKLKEYGLYREGLIQRIIDKERIPQAFDTGTDRDSESVIDYHGGADGEDIAIKENDVFRGDCTYVSSFTKQGARVPNEMALLIYAPEAIKPLQPSENRTNSFSNGFSYFVHPQLKRPSLLGIFENGQVKSQQ